MDGIMDGIGFGGNGDDELLFGGGPVRRGELFVLRELVAEDLHNGGPPNEPGDQNALHLVPGLPVAVNSAAGNGDEVVAVNEQLQQSEHEDLKATRKVLGQVIRGNAINAEVYYRVFKSLRAKLPKEGPYRIPYSQAEYARLLERMARLMTILSREIFEKVHCNRRLEFDALFQPLQETTLECPVEYGECLDRLCEHMTAAASIMQNVDGVYILSHREEFADRLRSLAARLLRPDV